MSISKTLGGSAEQISPLITGHYLKVAGLTVKWTWWIPDRQNLDKTCRNVMSKKKKKKYEKLVFKKMFIIKSGRIAVASLL